MLQLGNGTVGFGMGALRVLGGLADSCEHAYRGSFLLKKRARSHS